MLYFSLANATELLYIETMNSRQFKNWLTKKGCTFEKGRGGHLVVRLRGRKSILPMHGGRKQLGTGLMNKITKDLGL